MLQMPLAYLPNHYSGTNRHIQRVLGAKLRYLYCPVTQFQHFIRCSEDFVAQHKNDLFIGEQPFFLVN